MTPRDEDDDEHHHVPDTFRVYRYTTIYIAIAITVVFVLLLWDIAHGPLPPPTMCPR
jgi:hypothetical protein